MLDSESLISSNSISESLFMSARTSELISANASEAGSHSMSEADWESGIAAGSEAAAQTVTDTMDMSVVLQVKKG